MMLRVLGAAMLLGSGRVAGDGGDPPRTPRPTLADHAWLSPLQAPAVLEELQACAHDDRAPFAEGFGPDKLAQTPGGWTGLVLMNKGVLDDAGCLSAPRTCAVLAGLTDHLMPRPGAEEVGVRLLKLEAGASLRPHVGPGGRLVAHLGVVVPEGATLTIGGEDLRWTEGGFAIFDDSLLHSAQNRGATARYILHVTFPKPTAVVLTAATPHLHLAVSSDCTVKVTNLRNQISSRVEPMVHLYNKVADNHTANLEPCISAKAINATAIRITAAHGYGTVDLVIKTGDTWLVFTLGDLSKWAADPVQKHLRIATLCPVDMCPTSLDGSPWEKPIAAAPFTGGRFEGFRGSEGEYPDSAGFFTISSQFQMFTTWMFAETGQMLGYTLCPTDELPAVRSGLRSTEDILPPSPNRGRSWWWTSSSETLLNSTIATAHAMGVELLFFDGMLANQGDFTVDLKSWPSGLTAAGNRIKAAGLQVGLHMIDTGAQTCHGSKGEEPVGVNGSAGSVNPSCATVTVTRPDIFVPQGLAPRDWYYPQTAGTWYCHEMSGSVCQDQTRIQCDSSVPLQANETHPGGCCQKGTPGCSGHITPPPNNIQLSGAADPLQYWCRLGRFRSGGGLCFDGKTTLGSLAHSEEYNFTESYYGGSGGQAGVPPVKGSGGGGGVNKSSEFTLQMVVHPVGPTTGKVQVLADKPGSWKLSINAKGTIDWAVNLAGTMTVATGATVIAPHVPGVPGGYVIKATHAGGSVKIFVCALTTDFKCTMPDADGVAHGTLPLVCGVNNITFGGSSTGSGGVTDGYDGGMEEMFLYMMSLENVNAMLFSCPNTGCVNWYVFDFTNPESRAWWANGTSRMFNQAGAAVSQWDGNEFQGSIAGWDVPHSDATLTARTETGGNYWAMAQHQAAYQSQALWTQRTAVEGGGGGGLGPWKADMAPFADEATIHGPLCGPGGDQWHEQILLRTLETGMLLNGYHTSAALPREELDCFIGGLVATGIAPQMSGASQTAASLARIKYWLDLFKVHGMATEDKIYALHYPDVFLVELQGGNSPTPSYGLYVGNSSTTVALPVTVADNATVLTYQGDSATCVKLSVGGQKNITTITFFAANNGTLALSGGFWQSTVTQTVTAADGTCAVTAGGKNAGCAGATTYAGCTAASTAKGVSGWKNACVFTATGTKHQTTVPASAGGVKLALQIGEYATFSVAPGS